ncbi:MAG: helix-turn-helix domain-containing protein [Ruminiclostridium sp.]
MKLTVNEIVADLRRERGISSTEALAKELEPFAQKYGITISKSTLNDLENVQKNYGYKIFCALADFYKVSVDYLLGRSDDVRSPNPKVQELSQYTNLTENAIESLKYYSGDSCFHLVSHFLSVDAFYKAMEHICKYLEAQSVSKAVEKIGTFLINRISKLSLEETVSDETNALVSSFKEFCGKHTEHFHIHNDLEFFPSIAINLAMKNSDNYADFEHYCASHLFEEIVSDFNRRAKEMYDVSEIIQEFIDTLNADENIGSESKQIIANELREEATKWQA